MEKTVVVYSIPIAVMHDYTRSGVNRYGSPDELTRNIQTLTVNKDRSFSFTIDRGAYIQSEMVSSSGEALARQIREVIVPEFDTYVFAKIAESAKNAGGYDTTALTNQNAYAYFLRGQEWLGDHNVPDVGRVAFCSYRFSSLIMQDPAFVKYSDRSQEMVIKGILGEIDGCKIVKVPSGHLPAGAAFIIATADAVVAPKQLEDYKVHDNPPGVSGWLIEGRVIYDAFILNEKRNGVYYHGGQSVFKSLDVVSAATAAGKSTLIINGVMDANGSKWYYDLATSAANLETIQWNTAITTANWTEMKDSSNNPINYVEVTASTNTIARVIEVDSAGKPIAVADVPLNVG